MRSLLLTCLLSGCATAASAPAAPSLPPPAPSPAPEACRGDVPVAVIGKGLIQFQHCVGDTCLPVTAAVRKLGTTAAEPRDTWLLTRGELDAEGELHPDCGNYGECQYGVALACGAPHDTKLTLVLDFEYRWVFEPRAVEAGHWTFREVTRAGAASLEADPGATPPEELIWRWSSREAGYRSTTGSAGARRQVRCDAGDGPSCEVLLNGEVVWRASRTAITCHQHAGWLACLGRHLSAHHLTRGWMLELATRRRVDLEFPGMNPDGSYWTFADELSGSGDGFDAIFVDANGQRRVLHRSIPE